MELFVKSTCYGAFIYPLESLNLLELNCISYILNLIYINVVTPLQHNTLIGCPPFKVYCHIKILPEIFNGKKPSQVTQVLPPM